MKKLLHWSDSMLTKLIKNLFRSRLLPGLKPGIESKMPMQCDAPCPVKGTSCCICMAPMVTLKSHLQIPGSTCWFGSRVLAFVLLMVFSLFVSADEKVSATVLYFDEVEPGVEPYTTRYIIGDSIMRIDEGSAKDSFVLFNARSRELYTVTHSDRSILRISSTEKPVLPDLKKRFESFDTRLDPVDEPSEQKVAGIAVINYALTAEQRVCARFSSADGLLPGELAVLRIYAGFLAANNARNIQNQPAEYITTCMLANEIYAADWYLSKGFPIVYMETNGVTRFLKNYQSQERVDAGLFELPKDYREIVLGDKIGL